MLKHAGVSAGVVREGGCGYRGSATESEGGCGAHLAEGDEDGVGGLVALAVAQDEGDEERGVGLEGRLRRQRLAGLRASAMRGRVGAQE